MQLLKTVEGLRCYLAQIRQSQLIEDPANSFSAPLTLGLVPTMGALHPGHLSLIQRARRENDRVVVSIFVNPLQFGPNEDLGHYPRPLDQDQQLCETEGVDVIFAPTVEAFYKTEGGQLDQITQVIPPPAMTEVLCGSFRPGHFEGVATVVTKLLNLVQPNRTYFGRKDAQQLAILRRQAADLNLPGEIIPCQIVREADGLAYSSRNQYLTSDERQQAPGLYHSLNVAESLFKTGERDRMALINSVKTALAQYPALRLEYVDLVHPRTLAPLEQVETAGLLAIAAYLGNTRLIDNCVLRSRKPIVAIDGPAGAGKSTVARLVAEELGLLYLDTGAMYRAVTWLVRHEAIDPQDAIAVAELLPHCHIHLAYESAGVSSLDYVPPSPGMTRVWVNDQEVTQAIRSPEVTAQVSYIAAHAAVRKTLLGQQKQYGVAGGVVMEGRDIGTHVFPDAELKVFLTASVQERARRRQRDLVTQQQSNMSLEELERSIYERDRLDSSRAIAPLQKAADAIEVITDNLTIAQVVDKIVMLYRQHVQGVELAGQSS
ncbi:MAG: bifunctional pantoate--beta-alanine ligase/(d)CMP kinase [Cyanobacteria bacterium P01_A01_bin.123]